MSVESPCVMGVINVTPDSFSDGGACMDPLEAADRACRLVEDGAQMLDIGAESTRPGSLPVPAPQQIARLAPALRAIRRAAPGVPMTVDTTLAEVARAALDLGADAVNDQSAGRDDAAMFALVRQRACGLVLMHRHVSPRDDAYSDRLARAPIQGDVVAHVRAFLEERLMAAIEAGIAPEAIALDPGLGFGKTVLQNLELIVRTRELLVLGRPIVSALSRKSFVGRVTLGRDSTPAERTAGTVGLSLLHRDAGAAIFRVHDVAEVASALRSG